MKPIETLALEVAREMGFVGVDPEQINFARRLMDKIAEQSQPVAWIRPSDLYISTRAFGGGHPLYIHPKPDTEIEALLGKQSAEIANQYTKLTRYRAAMKMAVEAMEKNTDNMECHFDFYFESLSALRECLKEE